ncbi:MAG: tryptophan-rich sensory protein [Gammaproteobacteria bacterium]|nr:tryptophan-rich sensory protein [Gammaproteobacteria bacterium]MBU1440384.1 tryptophan-rich sensory protein [Gammaproteobacteria bacterium]MBU2287310.1 tryptophan-rich sensory protein [Gammaproteobacteria bacterium]
MTSARPATRRRLWRPVFTAAAAACLVALLGGLMTDLGPWYRGLVQPAWKPPDWLFGPVWTVIYALAAAAAVVAWRRAPDRASRETLLVLFSLNAFLNVLWSLLYFRLHRPDWALIEVVFLWLSIVALIVRLRGHARSTPWLLLPYLAWVSFAAVLNLATVRLNGPFG